MTDAPDSEAQIHRSHKAPESIRNLLERLGFKRPENPIDNLESPETLLNDSEDE